MQKLIQRAEQASRSAARRTAKARSMKESSESALNRVQTEPRIRMERALLHEARKNRQEDWAAGPLAPRRDVGERTESYGSVSYYQHALANPNTKDVPKRWTIAEGDRVVMTGGRDRGRIGRVTQINEDTGGVVVQNLNVTDVYVPAWLQEEENTKRTGGSIHAIPTQIHVKHLKLVYPLPHPETGVPRDVVIDRLQLEGQKDDRHRVIPGTNTVIPWPEQTDPEFKDHDDDTRRIAVEEQTFRPVLLHPPMPMSVIDELRNKYSKFRTRHDYDFLQRMEAQDARMERRKELGKTMKLPVQELAELRAKQKKAEERELTNEQLAKIGEVIAAEKARARDFVQASS